LRKRLYETYRVMRRFHDLWIILAWTGAVTAIMLNTYYHRSCVGFTQLNDLTDPCQSFTDLALLFAAATGASLAFTSEGTAIVGFLFVHLFASMFFVIALAVPSFLGLEGSILSDILLVRSLSIALRYLFPFALITSFLGSLFGLFLEGKLRLSEA